MSVLYAKRSIHFCTANMCYIDIFTKYLISNNLLWGGILKSVIFAVSSDTTLLHGLDSGRLENAFVQTHVHSNHIHTHNATGFIHAIGLNWTHIHISSIHISNALCILFVLDGVCFYMYLLPPIPSLILCHVITTASSLKLAHIYGLRALSSA